MSDNKCVQQIAMNFGIGSALGASIGERELPELVARLRECGVAWRAAYAQRLQTLDAGAVYGTYESIRYKVRVEVGAAGVGRGVALPSARVGTACTCFAYPSHTAHTLDRCLSAIQSCRSPTSTVCLASPEWARWGALGHTNNCSRGFCLGRAAEQEASGCVQSRKERQKPRAGPKGKAKGPPLSSE